jgi:uncharacterized membrane protein YraQ (UPF0718 family)
LNTIAFLYSGPAIDILAIALTARVSGWQMGLARAISAVAFSVIIGLVMAFLFREEEDTRQKSLTTHDATEDADTRTLAQTTSYFAVLAGILVFAAWGKPSLEVGFWSDIFDIKWYIVAALLITFQYACDQQRARAQENGDVHFARSHNGDHKWHALRSAGWVSSGARA